MYFAEKSRQLEYRTTSRWPLYTPGLASEAHVSQKLLKILNLQLAKKGIIYITPKTYSRVQKVFRKLSYGLVYHCLFQCFRKTCSHTDL